MSQLQTIVDNVLKTHEQRYSEDCSQLVPMVMSIKGDQISGVYLIKELMDSEFRNLTKSILAEIVLKTQCDAYIVCSEAWMATYPDANIQRPPSERDDRVEVVITAGFSPKETFCRIQEIVRDSSGNQASLKVCDFKGNAFQSRFNIYEGFN